MDIRIKAIGVLGRARDEVRKALHETGYGIGGGPIRVVEEVILAFEEADEALTAALKRVDDAKETK